MIWEAHGFRWDDAIAAFQQILTIDAGNALALQNIAAMHLSDNDLTAAEQFARRAIDRDPQLAKAHTTLGVVFARSRRLDQAAASWTRAVELDPTEFDAMYNLVILLAESGRIGEALKRPDADHVRAVTGYAIGGIPPFGHATPLPTFMDRDLLAFAEIWAAAGTPRCVMKLEPQALRDATQARVIPVY